MSNDRQESPRPLPEDPDIRHLKDQAKDLFKGGGAKSLTGAQFKIARLHGFESWPKLKSHVESLKEIGALKQAIDTNDLAEVTRMMAKNPQLHRAPLGYGQDGPLTWVAECRIPCGPPTAVRLDMAQWMIENGSDVHQGGDGPLMRAALNNHRVAMMDLLVRYGADVNAKWHGWFPITFASCESLDPVPLKWLLDHGADPNGALDYAIGTYARSPQRLSACIDLLLAAGATTKYNIPAFLELLRGRLDRLTQLLKEKPLLLHERFAELDCGASGGRRLTLKGATLLHVAAEYGLVEGANLLLDHGAGVNARAAIGEDNVGGQTPIFHSATQNDDAGLAITQLLIDRGADLSIGAKLPGDYERPDEFVECTPLGYALLFPGTRGPTVSLLRERGGKE